MVVKEQRVLPENSSFLSLVTLQVKRSTIHESFIYAFPGGSKLLNIMTVGCNIRRSAAAPFSMSAALENSKDKEL